LEKVALGNQSPNFTGWLVAQEIEHRKMVSEQMYLYPYDRCIFEIGSNYALFVY
jgi:hypothetical protein